MGSEKKLTLFVIFYPVLFLLLMSFCSGMGWCACVCRLRVLWKDKIIEKRSHSKYIIIFLSLHYQITL